MSSRDGKHEILSFYNISTLTPTKREDIRLNENLNTNLDWVEKLSTDEQYKLLGELVNTTSGNGSKTLYNYDSEDCEDPLTGRGTNVVLQLIEQKVIKSKDDPKLNQFLISSQQFDSQKFLSAVHKDSSIEGLFKSSQFLERNIQMQTLELKLVIDDNFVRFVNCKKAIDMILENFRKLKTQSQFERENSKVFDPQKYKKTKNNVSLTSDLEEHVNHLNMSSTLVFRPVMEHQRKEANLVKLLRFIDENKFLLNLPKNLIEAFTTHDKFIELYNGYLHRYRAIQAKQNIRRNRMNELAKMPDKILELIELKQENQMMNTLLLKVFHETDLIVAQYKKKINDELLSINYDVKGLNKLSYEGNAKFVELVDKIQQLSQDNVKQVSPISEFLGAQIHKFSSNLEYQMLKFDSKFQIMRKSLWDYMSSLPEKREGGSYVYHINEKYSEIDNYLKATSAATSYSKEDKQSVIVEIFSNSDNLDLSFINENWLVFVNFINFYDGALISEMEKFITNYCHYYRSPNSNVDYDGTVRDSFLDVIVTSTEKLYTLFAADASNSERNILSPEKYSHFLPHHTNSLSTIYYLSSISKKINHILTEFGRYVVLINKAKKTPEANNLIKFLREASSTINETILEAICAVWINDCSQFYVLEDWQIDQTQHEENHAVCTRNISVLEGYEYFVLRKISELVFIEKPASDSDSVNIVSTYPSKKTLVGLEIQFMRSLAVLIDSMMKIYNVEKSKRKDVKEEDVDNELFKVFTMNNLDRIMRFTYPILIREFDNLFGNNLLQQNLKLFADIDKASLVILDDILKREKIWIDEIVGRFFLSIPHKDVADKQKLKIDSFFYEVLVHFVKLVHIDKPITGKELFVGIINELQYAFLKCTLDYLKSILQNKGAKFILGNLKLGVIFFVEIFEASKSLKLNEDSMKLVDVLLQTIEENEQVSYSQEDFENKLRKSLKYSRNEFDCFL